MAWQLPTRAVNPPIRVDDVVIFWDGATAELTEEAIARLDRGEEVVVSKPPWFNWNVELIYCE